MASKKSKKKLKEYPLTGKFRSGDNQNYEYTKAFNANTDYRYKEPTYTEKDSESSLLELGRIGDIVNTPDDIVASPKKLETLLRANMVPTFDYDDYVYRKKFNRTQFPYHQAAISNVREYLFFTKPDLNILKDDTTLSDAFNYDDFWIHMYKHYRRVIADLSLASETRRQDVIEDKNLFIPMLTNFVASNLDLPGVSAETTETSSNIYGTNIQYRKTSLKSDENYDFSLDFIDIPTLDLYHFFKMWDQYTTYKDLGMVGPRDYENPKQSEYPGYLNTGYYRQNKVLHDQISIYKFIVNGDDMETILYYAKLTGCFPKSVPREVFGNFKGEGPLMYSIDWHAQFVEDMKPAILKEFNAICRAYFQQTGRDGNIKENNLKGIPEYYGYKQVDMFRGESNGGYGILDGRHMSHPYVQMVAQEGAKEEEIADNFKFVLKWYDKQ